MNSYPGRELIPLSLAQLKPLWDMIPERCKDILATRTSNTRCVTPN
jgi:hypothetical protein